MGLNVQVADIVTMTLPWWDGVACGMAVTWSARALACVGRLVATAPARAVGINGRHDAPAEVRRSITGRGALGIRPRCRRCWWRAGVQADHVIPAAWGGPGAGWNLRPLCAGCNGGRGASLSIAELVWLLVPGPRDWPVWVLAIAWELGTIHQAVALWA